MPASSIVSDEFASLKRFLDTQLQVSPHHEKFFRRRFQNTPSQDIEFLNDLAGWISRLIDDDIRSHCEDYSWLCEQQMAEELHFRRYGRYRLSTFEEAFKEVYDDKEYMTKYMNGLLITQLWWSNHTKVMQFYRNEFLARNATGFSHLEIGPGHGLFLYFAAQHPSSGEVRGWDISKASVALTEAGLRKLGAAKMPQLELQDMFDKPAGSFDSVVFSEVLEHMEHPRKALEVIRSVMAPDGRLFLNMPINSPAPDHLFNAETPEALEQFVVDAGYTIEDRRFFPATNQNIEDARRKRLTISCAFIARPN